MSIRWLSVSALIVAFAFATWFVLSADRISPPESSPTVTEADSTHRAERSEPRLTTRQEPRLAPPPWSAGLPPELQFPPDTDGPQSETAFWSVTGRLLDADTEDPIEGALVRLGRVETASKADGSFELSAPESNYTTLAVRHRFFRFDQAMKLARDLDLGDIRIRGGATLQGRVVDPEGLPVKDAIVRLQAARLHSEQGKERLRPLKHSRIVTADDGTFAIDALPKGRYAFRATSPDHTASEAILVDVAGYGVLSVELRLGLPGTVRGMIVDSLGALVPNAEAWLTPESRLEAPRREDWTYKSEIPLATWNRALQVREGQIEYQQTPAGHYTISIRSDEIETRQVIHVKPGETSDVRITISTQSVIAGRLVQIGGEPVADALVRLFEGTSVDQRPLNQARTSESGVFEFPAIRGETYRLMATKTGFFDASETVLGGHDEVLLELEQSGTLEGIVIDQADSPVAGATLIVDGMRFDTQEDGRFRLEALRREVAHLRVTASGFYPWESEYSVSSGEVRTNFVVRLQRFGGVQGTVVGSNGEIPESIYAGCVDCDVVDHVNEGNEFHLSPMKPGQHTIFVSSRKNVPSYRQVRVVADHTVRADFRQEPGIRLHGRVLTRKGRPIPNAELRFKLGSGTSRTGARATCDEDGNFETDPTLLPGSGEVVISLRESLSYRIRFERALATIPLRVSSESGTQEQHFECDLGETVLEGSLHEHGRPMGQVWVGFSRKLPWRGGYESWATTDDKGLFRLDWLEPGPGILVVKQRQGDRMGILATLPFEVPDQEIVRESFELNPHSLCGTLDPTSVGVGHSYIAVQPVGGETEPGTWRIEVLRNTERFELAGLREGRYRIFALRSPSGWAAAGPIHLSERQVDVGTIRLEPTGDLIVHLLDASGEPVLAELELVGQPVWQHLNGDSRGYERKQYTLPPGSYTVKASVPGFEPILRSHLRVEPGKETSTTIQLRH